MKPGFEPGITGEIVVTVTEDMCPSFNGVVVHRCYATWSLVHHVELAARKVLVDYLEPDEEGIGSHVSADHLAPCGVGKKVTVKAKLIEVIEGQNPQVICEVTAYDGDRLLAKGKQIQIVMNKDRLTQLIERS